MHKLHPQALVLLILLATSRALFASGQPFTDLDGNTHRLEEFQGKWVVVNYWATWCPPCLAEIPELVLFHDKHKSDDAVVLGMNMENISIDSLTTFVDENMLSYPVIPQANNMPILGEIPGLPTTYLVSPQGKVVAVQTGQITADMIESFINQYDADSKQ